MKRFDVGQHSEWPTSCRKLSQDLPHCVVHHTLQEQVVSRTLTSSLPALLWSECTHTQPVAYYPSYRPYGCLECHHSFQDMRLNKVCFTDTCVHRYSTKMCWPHCWPRKAPSMLCAPFWKSSLHTATREPFQYSQSISRTPSTYQKV